jgi:hypothetical protein
MAWFGNKEQSLNLKIHSAVLLKHHSYYNDTRGVTILAPNRNLDLRFGRRKGSNGDNEQSHIPLLK